MSDHVSVKIVGLGGSAELTLPADATVADLREAAGGLAGLILRTNGQTVRDEASTPVASNQVFVSAPPEAKHGALI